MIQSKLNTNERKPNEAAYNDRKSSVRIILHDYFFKKQILEYLIQNYLYTIPVLKCCRINNHYPFFTCFVLPSIIAFLCLSYLMLNVGIEHTAC